MIDEAFMPLRGVLEEMLAWTGEVRDEAAGIRFFIHSFEIESPVELDVIVDASGHVSIGTTPPIYYVDTSIRPSFHRIRFVAEESQE